MLLESVEDITVGTRVCSHFDKYPGQNFFGQITERFDEENLWHVIYDDGDEEDLANEEVLDAVNLAMTLYREDPSADSNDPPTPITPAAGATSSTTTETTADRQRALQERNLGAMMGEFDSLCTEGEATDPASRQTRDVHEDGDVFDEEVQSGTPAVLEDDQCSWCGFRDHTRKTRKSCPQHADYDGDVYNKGDKVNEDWVPGTRASHSRTPRRKLTPTSVRSAPMAASWTTEDWTVGVGALEKPEEFDPKEFEGASTLTYPKASLGWTVDTPPLDLVRQFYPASALTLTLTSHDTLMTHTHVTQLMSHSSCHTA